MTHSFPTRRSSDLKWTATLSPEFNVFLANEGWVTLRADYSYKSTMAADAENTPELFSGNVSLVNASLTYSAPGDDRSEEHTSELQSLMRTSYAVFCLNKKKKPRHLNIKLQY